MNSSSDSSSEQEDLEQVQQILIDLTDKVGLEEVLSILEEICYNKARASRFKEAREWNRIGAIILSLKELVFKPSLEVRNKKKNSGKAGSSRASTRVAG